MVTCEQSERSTVGMGQASAPYGTCSGKGALVTGKRTRWVHDAEVDQLVGECSACNLHTALALVAKMRGLGIQARCDTLVMQPTLAMQRRKQRRFQQQMAFCRSPAGVESQPGQWGHLTPDLLLEAAWLLADADVQVAACVCQAWREIIGSSIHSISFTWAARGAPEQVNSVVCGAAVLFRALRSISLRRCAALSDAALARLMRSSCPQLEVLDLSCCRGVGDAGIATVAAAGARLHTLSLSSCHQLTDAAFAALGARCGALAHLNACGCELLGDAGLAALAAGARNLRSVNLGWCERVTEAGVAALAAGCPGLRALDLCGCIWVGDAGVVAVARLCPQLAALGLHCCRRLTDAAVGAAAAHLRHLTSLNVSGCVSLSPAAVQAVVDANPGLHTCGMRRNVIVGGVLPLIGVDCACRKVLVQPSW